MYCYPDCIVGTEMQWIAIQTVMLTQMQCIAIQTVICNMLLCKLLG